MLFMYTVVFFVGVTYTVITFLLGGVFGLAHIGAHFDTHIDIHSGLHPHLDVNTGANGESSSLGVFPIKPITIVALITVFGGVGMIGTHYGINPIILFATALVSGFIVSFLLYRYIIVPLYKAQNTSAVSKKSLIGMKAKVISPIIEEGFGTIAYVVNGSRYNAPAQHVGKRHIDQGEEVIIYEIKNNVFYVEPLNDKSLKGEI